ncbi:bifunctional riboflavin kinase/FAD synthetase [Streptococcus sciuri]|uniref:Riboflavin biosynthesis protein n=1 Tax=Streptococcus sciuri TaxID=2973939 RepID=A0ABT2F770_9STRE|nr:bifunctional riboflavin kinase/FAD synthetase [Streptococcus sciuri]MCS4487662.1 bifunctional riboflavin kinase/FAD synthetase [Streptococcus sciuri]
MEIYNITHYSQLDDKNESVLVLGYFDGLHRGHKALFDKAREIAQKEQLRIVVLTFKENPQLTFDKYHPDLLKHLTYPQRRYDKFAEYGVDTLYLTDFTTAFSHISSDDFIKHFIKGVNAKAVVVGFDYKFGYDRTDSAYLARHFEGEVYTLSQVSEDGEKISSSRIRKLILKGQIAQANALLGYPFSTRGIVVHGDARGRTIGFPTANLAPIDRTFLPADGVYVTKVHFAGKDYDAMTSIGKNITFGGTELRLEAHLFDFSEEIYGETIEIIWMDKIRDMIQFSGIDELVFQLEKDREFVLNWKKNSQKM